MSLRSISLTGVLLFALVFSPLSTSAQQAELSADELNAMLEQITALQEILAVLLAQQAALSDTSTSVEQTVSLPGRTYTAEIPGVEFEYTLPKRVTLTEVDDPELLVGEAGEALDAESWALSVDEALVGMIDLTNEAAQNALDGALAFITFIGAFAALDDDTDDMLNLTEEPDYAGFGVRHLEMREDGQAFGVYLADYPFQYDGDTYVVYVRVSYGSVTEDVDDMLSQLELTTLELKTAAEAKAFLEVMLDDITIDEREVGRRIEASDTNLLQAAVADAEDATLKSNLSNLRVQAEIHYNDNDFSYSGFCSNDTYLDIKSEYQTGCRTNGDNSYIIYAELSTGADYCIDSTGRAGEYDSISSRTMTCE